MNNLNVVTTEICKIHFTIPTDFELKLSETPTEMEEFIKHILSNVVNGLNVATSMHLCSLVEFTKSQSFGRFRPAVCNVMSFRKNMKTACLKILDDLEETASHHMIEAFNSQDCNDGFHVGLSNTEDYTNAMAFKRAAAWLHTVIKLYDQWLESNPA